MRFPMPPTAVLLLLLAALTLGQDMTLLLKQAADGLLVNSLPGFAAKLGGVAAAQLPARVGQPGPGDLAIRRLQVRLALLVEDRWKDLTDSQRWAILQTQGQIQHQIIYKSPGLLRPQYTTYGKKFATEV
jgi:hypothetical protein